MDSVLCGIPVNMEEYEPRANFKKLPCDECGEICWIGPRQFILQLEQSLEFLCLTCIKNKYGVESFEDIKHLGG